MSVGISLKVGEKVSIENQRAFFATLQHSFFKLEEVKDSQANLSYTNSRGEECLLTVPSRRVKPFQMRSTGHYREMPAGPEMDALVAEKVMDWERAEGHGDFFVDNTGEVLAPGVNFSFSMKDEWFLLLRRTLLAQGYKIVLESALEGHVAKVLRPTLVENYALEAKAEGTTEAVALCRAALMAVADG